METKHKTIADSLTELSINLIGHVHNQRTLEEPIKITLPLDIFRQLQFEVFEKSRLFSPIKQGDLS